MSESAPIRVVLVGCGAVARLFYKPALLELERLGAIKVVGAVDPSSEARSELGNTFKTAATFPDIKSVSKTNATMAIVASPPRFHREQTESLLKNGMHVLCEKPMAGNVADCQAMISVAERENRILAVGHYKRFFPSHQFVRHLIRNRTLGALQAIAIQEGGKFRWPAASGSFFDKAQTAGGVLLDIGVHVLDLLLWWLGKPVSFTYQDDALDGIEANAFLDASYANGVTTTVRLSRDSETLNTYAFQFERAVVHLRVNQANRAEITMADMPMTLSGQLTEPICQRFPMSTVPLDTNPQAFVAQLINVISAIECGQTPLVPGIEGIRAIEWIEECYRTRVPINVAWMPHSDGIEQCVLR